MQTHHIVKTHTLSAIRIIVILLAGLQSSMSCCRRSKRTAMLTNCSLKQTLVSRHPPKPCESIFTTLLSFHVPYPSQKKIEADGVQESRLTSSSPVFSTNLGRSGVRKD